MTPIALDQLRIIQLIAKLRIGGIEQLATDLTLTMSRRVSRIVVCTSGGTPFEPILRRAEVPIELIPSPIPPRPGRLLAAAVAVARILRRERPDLIHAHNPAAGAVAALARLLARQPGVAIVTTYHGVQPDRVARAVLALRLSSELVVTVTPDATRALSAAGLPPRQSATVLNGVQVQPRRTALDVRREFAAEGADLIVTVGRYEREKNHALLLEALVSVAERRPRLRAVLVGGGPLEAELRRESERRGLADIVVFAGERDDAVDIAAAADVFVLTSTWEGLPLALLEAMALARPIVSTAVGGVMDALRHEETALLVPAGDASRFAGALERLLEDGSLRERIGANARAFARLKFSRERMLDRYGVIYTSVVAQRRRQRGWKR